MGTAAGALVGTAVGVFASWAMNHDWGGGKSLTGWLKDGLKGLFN